MGQHFHGTCPANIIHIGAKVDSLDNSTYQDTIRSWGRQRGRIMCLLKYAYCGFDRCKLFCLCSALVNLQLEWCPLLGCPVRERCGQTRMRPVKGMIKELGHLSYMERLGKLGLFFLGRQGLGGSLQCV